ncbi:alpha/beta hydrolase [Streptomyces alboniger]|uniref:DUF1023 domain-containing protein n=1 Tax=Streptomyces alboniger TaxID=132473 RepID=A0A5J6HMA4_STRAD|nr:alpha/beta hydrolase [Streptomyces alboniger]QEV20598.1 hypothetical protein CP975_26370 [Streptomyces alboniger]
MNAVLTWQQLRDLKLAELNEAGDGWGAVSDRADSDRVRVEAEMTGALTKTQESESARSAVRRLKRLGRNYEYIQTECGLIRSTVNGLSHELNAPQRRLKEALDDAAALSYTVHGDGSITYPAGGEQGTTGKKVPGGTVIGNNGMLAPGNTGLFPPGNNGLYQPGLGPGAPKLLSPNPHQAKAQDIADRISRAVREAREIDARFSRSLLKLKAEPGLKVDAGTWADAAKDAEAVRGVAYEYLKEHIPQDKSPAERKAWWEGLTKDQRAEYLAVYPDVIGNLDGIPATVRDEANRNNLNLLIGEMEGRGDEKAKTQLAGLQEIDRKLAENERLRLKDPKEPPMLLLGIGGEGGGRAIVAYGNPDTSRNVSAYVPGLGTALDKDFVNNDVARRAHDTAVGAREIDPSSAAIVWLGYDAPQIGPDSDSLLGNLAVMQDDDAKQGAAAYNSFMSGLDATNRHDDPHLTAIGHSYGSRTVGAAAQMDGGIPSADDILFVGSPGVGVDRAEDLGVGKGHVYVGAADNDPVTHLPSKQEAWAGAAGILAGPPAAYLMGDMADRGDDDIWFGRDPASESFGATRFKVDDGPIPVIGGEGPIDAHSNYFDPAEVRNGGDPESAANIAAVVAGRPDLLIPEQHR